ncbi:phytoene desaturase [Rhodococcus sp. BP-252]|uniref:phytoene desaturase family protein n=1 Tax=unclassified Rhodococcus (in: high G+C Gram-positive bacteria) TaxID=192944 RepID=UPI001C9A71DE|nr:MULTISPECIES: phytoene desaturase family protein [unclassified Rhodococcus (in: high G+C Gram-positive bacteria)]MBY6411370.1 phytoene desaturase [Rhodococcus sp. BP-320]MBY6416029.1 phytoene desaturase [Rhodococcus sp. BP-321]MBY6420462.1 phytoene desaturase [Rhodococcus sp. BP-324]MBY6426236.1 phytoene desaturase [Rhodococcus sp. BP-323]MBY6431223.1 phytoene desaturase [Rhodococcus sp. BP-322]
MSTPRSIAGPTDSVVVVGAGLAGLSAALHLTGAGRRVTVLERDDAVGGRVGTYTVPGDDGQPLYDIDNGASVLTMPELIASALGAVGESFDSTSPPLRLKTLSPSYHTRYADGSHIDVFSDPERMAAEVERACGPNESQGYRRLRRWLAAIFDAEFDRYIDSNFDSPLDLVSSRPALRDTAKLLVLGGFGRLGPRVGSYLKDERLRRVFTFQALYAGMAPAKALAVYGAIAHMDTSMGVYFPEGGMSAIARSMSDALVRNGGTVVTRADVSGLDVAHGRVTAVETADGRRFPCDAVVLTPDLPVVDRLLDGAGITARGRRRGYSFVSPSAVVFHGTVPTRVTDTWPARAHHTIDFGDEWARTFTRITARAGRGQLMADPSLLITRPAVSDPSLLITRGGETVEPISVLAPCPNLDSAPLDWESLGEPYMREIQLVLEQRGYEHLAAEMVVDHLDTPKTWADKGMLHGSPFSSSHVFRQTGPFRRENLVRGVDNVVLAGSATTPGVGVPTVLVSGRLAAERVLGPRVTARDAAHTETSRFVRRRREALN